MSEVTSQRAAAVEAWTVMHELFLTRFRPRMLKLWREYDLAPPQQMTISMLDEPRPMGHLAQQMHCDNSNITGIVDRLSERGLVERRAAEGDRRVKLVALTGEGERIRAELERRKAEPPEELLALSDAELRRLSALLAKALAAGSP